MKILITGGAGYIGAHLVEELRNLGADCTVVDNLSRGLEERLNDSVDLAKIDLCDFAKIQKYMSGKSFDVVFHLAGYMQARESSRIPKEYWANNLLATQNLLRSLSDLRSTKFIFSSSCSIYGNNPLAFESSKLNPLSIYAKTKAEAESEIQKVYRHFRQNVTIFRFFNVVGCQLFPNFCDTQKETLLPSAARLILQGRSPVIYGNDFKTPDGFAIRDFIDVRDVVRAMVLPLHSNLAGIHNLSSGQSTSIYAMVMHLIEASNLANIKIEIGQRHLEDPSIVQSSASKEVLRLNWRPKYGLQESVKDFWSVFTAYFEQEQRKE